MSKVSFDRDRFAPGNIELAVTVSTPEYGVLWINRVPLEEGTRGNVMERRQYFGLIETDDKQFKVFRMNNVYELTKTVEEARAIYDKLRK